MNGHDHQVSLESINSLDLLLPYLRDTLGPNFESSSSPESLEVYALNINVTQSTYYQIGDTSLYRIGAYQVVELPMGNFTNDCGSNPLFSNLSISCLPEYKVANSSARLIPGRYSEYSPLDGEVKLVYDFAEYSPSSDLRAISISLNVYSADTGSVGVVEVVMDRSVLGKVSVDSRVTVLPMDFLYLGGSGSSMEWMRAIVHILLVAFASLTCIGYPLTKALSGDSWTTYFSLDFVVPITVCVLVIISFAYHFSVIFSNRLVEVNLGISNFVDLHVEADTLVFLNSLNAFTLTLLTMYVFTRHLAHGGRKMFLPIFLFTVVMLAVALGLALGWSTVMSFQDFFFLLTRIGLGNVNMDDWAMLTSVGGLSMVALIVFFVMCMYWFIGLGIGLVLGSSKGWWTAPAMSPNPTTPPEDVNGDDEIATSLDMMSARAETELDLVHDDIREELSEAKRRLDAASRAIKTVVSRRR